MQSTALGKMPFTHRLKKASRIMKMSAVLLLFACQALAHPGAAQITLKEKSASLEKVLKSLQRQSNYSLSFDQLLVKEKGKPVSITVDNVPVAEAVAIITKTQDQLEVILNGHIISVKEKEQVKKSAGLVTEGSGLKLEIAPLPPTVHGRITNEKGEAVAGVSISIKGGKTIGVTNDNGEFTLTNVADNAVLVFSAINTETLEIKLNGRSELAFSLKTKTSVLDEVQMIAYGSTSKRLQTGNVTTVKGEDIAKQPVSNPLLALEGRVPGLVITQNNGMTGGGVIVRIQGQNSIQNGNDPLFIIDGMPYVSQMLSTSSLGPYGGSGASARETSGNGNPLNYINPNDIESIEILKDADATAIYGSRAANGAILITTRKGKIGQTKGEISFQQGWGQVASKVDVMNTQQYLQMRREGLMNDNILFPSIIATPTNTDYDINGLWDTTRYTDWQKVLLGNNSNYTNINSSISGGSAAIQYFIGSTFHRETTVFPGNFSDQKASVHFNLNSISTNKKLKIQLSGSYLLDNNQLPNTDYTNRATSLAPDAPAIYNPDGSLNWAPNPAGTSSWTNPLSFSLNTYQNKTRNLISNAVLGYSIMKGMEFKSSFGYVSLQTDEISLSPLISKTPESRPTAIRGASYSNSTINSWIAEPQITYQFLLGKGKFDILFGTSFQVKNNSGLNFSGSGYNSDAVLEDPRSASVVNVNSSLNSIYKYNAFFGRINYNFKDEYILNINARRDGSSRFGPENRFNNFGSLGGAWIFSKEQVIDKSLPFLSFGKFHVSYGITGNDQIGDYGYLNLYNVSTPSVGYQGGTSLSPNGIPNPYLQWEETKNFQFGLDLGFLSDRIIFNSNYVNKKSSNQLLQYALPYTAGFTSIFENFPATVQNSGFEFSLNTINIKGTNLTWKTNVNVTFPKNKVISFPGLSTSTYASTLVIGEPISIKKTYHFVGINPSTGTFLFGDSHGNAVSSPSSSTDKNTLIDISPKAYGGIENSIGFKGFQIDFMIQFVKQFGVINYYFTNNSPNLPGNKSTNQPLTVLGRWQRPGDISSINRFTTSSSLIGSLLNALASDAAYSDASYLRLKNVSLSYKFPDRFNKLLHTMNTLVFMQGQNLFTITKYKGLDPETPGGSMPPLRVFTFGLQMGF